MKKSQTNYHHIDVANTMHNYCLKVNECEYLLTPWFGFFENIKPVRAGIYQVLDRLSMRVFFCNFDGEHWHYKAATIDQVIKPNIVGLSPVKYHAWRGILQD